MYTIYHGTRIVTKHAECDLAVRELGGEIRILKHLNKIIKEPCHIQKYIRHTKEDLVTELIQGQTLDRMFDLSLEKLKIVLSNVANTLKTIIKYAPHFAHRDLHPGNIIVNEIDLTSTIIDLGSAKIYYGKETIQQDFVYLLGHMLYFTKGETHLYILNICKHVTNLSEYRIINSEPSELSEHCICKNIDYILHFI